MNGNVQPWLGALSLLIFYFVLPASVITGIRKLWTPNVVFKPQSARRIFSLSFSAFFSQMAWRLSRLSTLWTSWIIRTRSWGPSSHLQPWSSVWTLQVITRQECIFQDSSDFSLSFFCDEIMEITSGFVSWPLCPGRVYCFYYQCLLLWDPGPGGQAGGQWFSSHSLKTSIKYTTQQLQSTLVDKLWSAHWPLHEITTLWDQLLLLLSKQKFFGWMT